LSFGGNNWKRSSSSVSSGTSIRSDEASLSPSKKALYEFGNRQRFGPVLVPNAHALSDVASVVKPVPVPTYTPSLPLYALPKKMSKKAKYGFGKWKQNSVAKEEPVHSLAKVAAAYNKWADSIKQDLIIPGGNSWKQKKEPQASLSPAVAVPEYSKWTQTPHDLSSQSTFNVQKYLGVVGTVGVACLTLFMLKEILVY
jgi:hypothetical protein